MDGTFLLNLYLYIMVLLTKLITWASPLSLTQARKSPFGDISNDP